MARSADGGTGQRPLARYVCRGRGRALCLYARRLGRSLQILAPRAGKKGGGASARGFRYADRRLAGRRSRRARRRRGEKTQRLGQELGRQKTKIVGQTGARAE